MDRLIIESIEGRIMLGITMFVAIMILVGWVAINEEARMAEFVEQHEGRSIERGAELFAASCSTCHGINGYGIAGRAPALNNPQFFGYSYLGTVNSEIASYQRDVADIQGSDDQIGTLELLERRLEELESEMIAAGEDAAAREAVEFEIDNVRATLSEDVEDVAARIAAIEAGEPIGIDAELTGSSDLDTRLAALQDNIPTRLAEADAALNGEEGLLAQREVLLEDLSSAMISGLYPRLDAVRAESEEDDDPLLLTEYLAQDADRLSQISFGGAIDSYITTTLIHGRPGSNVVWPLPMSSWSQRGGGPLRDDQIGDIVAYVMNWDKGDDWTLDDFNAVDQYARIYQTYTDIDSGTETVGDDVDAIVEAGLPEGDAARGELLYNAQEAAGTGLPVGCSGCHLNGLSAPDVAGTWTRVQNQRLALPEYEGLDGEYYLIEAIVHPGAYIVAPYADGLMPANFGDQLTDQDLADLIAYLMTQNQ